MNGKGRERKIGEGGKRDRNLFFTVHFYCLALVLNFI